MNALERRSANIHANNNNLSKAPLLQWISAFCARHRHIHNISCLLVRANDAIWLHSTRVSLFFSLSPSRLSSLAYLLCILSCSSGSGSNSSERTKGSLECVLKSCKMNEWTSKKKNTKLKNPTLASVERSTHRVENKCNRMHKWRPTENCEKLWVTHTQLENVVAYRAPTKYRIASETKKKDSEVCEPTKYERSNHPNKAETKQRHQQNKERSASNERKKRHIKYVCVFL